MKTKAESKHARKTRRVEGHLALSTRLSMMSDSHIQKLLRSTRTAGGWGRNQIVDVGGTEVFVKRIPVTALEAENRYSTRNLYRMPTYYNYGVGSAGFGVFRELAVHVKATNWVLAGEEEGFPLMHHHRLVTNSWSEAEFPGGLDNYIRYWNSSKSIRRYMTERATAPYEALIFLERLECTVGDSLQKKNSPGLARSLKQMFRVLDFLHERKVVHFDAHGGNIMVDRGQAYLCDFGLCLDADFELTNTEQRFLEKHRLYDYGELISGMGDVVGGAYFLADDKRRAEVRKQLGLEEEHYPQLIQALRSRADELVKKKVLRISPGEWALYQQYKPVIMLMDGFFSALRSNRRKNTPFPHQELKRRLSRAGVV